MTNENDAIKVLKTAGLLLLDAMIFQEAIVAPSSPNVKTLSQILASSSVKRELESTWQYICLLYTSPSPRDRG